MSKLLKLPVSSILHEADQTDLVEHPVLSGANTEPQIVTFVKNTSIVTCPREECGIVCDLLKTVEVPDRVVHLVKCRNGHFFVIGFGTFTSKNGTSCAAFFAMAPVDSFVISDLEEDRQKIIEGLMRTVATKKSQ